MLRRLQTPFSCLPGVSSGGGGIGGGASGAGKEVPAALGELVIKTGDKETQRSRRNNSWILLDFLEFLLDPPPSPRTGPNPHIPDPPELRPLPPSPPSYLSSLVAAAATAMIHLFFPRACLCFSYVRVLLNSVYFVLSHIARAAFPLQGHCACVCACVCLCVRAFKTSQYVTIGIPHIHLAKLPSEAFFPLSLMIVVLVVLEPGC